MSLPKPANGKAPRQLEAGASKVKLRVPGKSRKAASGLAPPRVKKTRVDPETAVKVSREAVTQPLAVNALELASEIEKGLVEGRLDVLSPQALQALMAALCKSYAANIEAGNTFRLLGDRSAVTGTDVMITCGALLKSADLQVFELGMWQSWTGR